MHGAVMDSSSDDTEVMASTALIAGELPLATWQATGDAEVDGALSRMLGLGSMTLAEQAEVFDGMHRSLRERLVNASHSSTDGGTSAEPGSSEFG